jgi:hypothetical protein
MPGPDCLPHPAEPVRTWQRQRCSSARCRSHQPLRVGESRENSNISWKALRPGGPRALPLEGRDTPRILVPRLPDSRGKPRSSPGARATLRLRPRATSATSTLTATVGHASTKGCAEATTPGVGDATTAGRIGVPRPNHPVRRSLAEPFGGRRFRPDSDPRLLSRSTRGKRDRNCGLRTTAWPVNWVGRTMTTSSSVTSPCFSPTPLVPGWSTCLRGKFPTGKIWSRLSPATSRARTCAPEIPGTSEAVGSCRENLSETTSGGSRSSAPSCPTSPTPMSSARSSPAPPAATWSASWVARPPPGRAS